MADPQDVLARTIWGEARGDGVEGMRAVACVVLNRAAHPRWWGRDVAGCCLAPWQFSCWNEGDPNLRKMRAAVPGTPMFTEALEVAAAALDGRTADMTGGADSYFAVGTATPGWARAAPFTRRILHHAFYRVELPAFANASMYSPAAIAVALTLGDQTTDDQNTGDQNTGDQNTGDQNTGDQNTGDQTTGNQTTDDLNIRELARILALDAASP